MCLHPRGTLYHGYTPFLGIRVDFATTKISAVEKSGPTFLTNYIMYT